MLLYAGFEKKKALLYNFLTALSAFIGVIVALILEPYVNNLIDFLLPYAAGNFIYIAGSDLIPDLHADTEFKHTLIQISMMVIGIILLYLLKIMK